MTESKSLIRNLRRLCGVVQWNVLACWIASVLAPAEEPPSGDVHIAITSVRFIGNQAISSADLDEMARPYLGGPLTLATLERLAGAVTEAYRAQGYSLARAFVPDQEVRGGVVEILVVEGRVGRLQVEGNRHYSEAFIRRYFAPVLEDQAFKMASLERALLLLILLLSSVLLAEPAQAQSFTGMTFFGDSNTDNGRFKYVPQYTTGVNAGALAKTGVFTTPGGDMWSVYLGARYGISVSPTAAPGGGNNYAAGGAYVAYAADNVIGENTWSAREQITSYLSSVNGKADPNTLYTLYIGTNDLKTPAGGLKTGMPNLVDPQDLAGLSSLASQTVTLAQRLSNAGAKYLVVPNIASTTKTQAAATAASFPWTQTWANSLSYYNQTVWNGIAARGINFIPVDFASGGDYVLQNPARFGIAVTSVTTPACGAVAAPNCTTADLVTPNAMNTYFFADTTGHVSSAVQKIQADIVYALLIAPGQVSMLANHASIGQIAMNYAYADQIFYSFRGDAPGTVGGWTQGGVQQVDIAGGQTSTSSTPYHGAIGMDYQYSQHVLLGGFVNYGQAHVNYGSGGNFTQSGTTVGAYAGYREGPMWANGFVAYNWLDNNVNRVTPIGITSFSNTSTVHGSNTSVVVQAGYNFDCDVVKHGPALGYSYVNTNIDGFTEAGNLTSLQFGGQNINAQVGSVGYQVQATVGAWLPFAKAMYNHHLGNTDRVITTTLTSVTAPSYTMPAVSYGRDWANLTAGIGYQIDPKTVIRAHVMQQVAQQGVDSYTATMSVSSYF
jgi:outer membrane lipase/esterase